MIVLYRLVALVALLVLLAPSAASLAQQPVLTIPDPATTKGGNASSTITVTDAFQKVFDGTGSSTAPAPGAGQQTRHGCTIVNYGTGTMWVSEGKTAATATKATSVQLAVNQAYYCQWNGPVLIGEIDITGTATDAFYAAQY